MFNVRGNVILFIYVALSLTLIQYHEMIVSPAQPERSRLGYSLGEAVVSAAVYLLRDS